MQFGILPLQVTAERLYAVWETATAAGQGHGSVYFYWFHDLFSMEALLCIESAPIGKKLH
jgi:hypothetical protein